MIKKLLPFMKKYKLPIILGPLMIICEVLLEIRIPKLMAQIVDKGIASNDINFVIKTGGTMLLMALIALIFGILSAKFSTAGSVGFSSELRKGLFNKIQEFSFANIDKFSTPSLVTRLTTDITSIQNAFMMIIRILVRAPAMLIGASIMAYSINKKLILIFFLAIPVLAVSFFVISRIAFPRFRKVMKKYDAMNASVQENLIGIHVVKSFVREDYEKHKFKDAVVDLINASIHAEKVIIFNMPIMQLTMYASIVAILWFGGNMIIGGVMYTGELISFITYMTQVLVSLMMISFAFIMMVFSRASVERVIEILDEKIDITDSDSGKDMQVQDGSVIFKDVFFKYNESAQNDVLENINLEIRSGETVGIIGGTGSAKTTLVQLIPRLYDATQGQIMVGGHDVRKYKMKDLREGVSMVLQKNVLFSGTIKENLLWGNAEATYEQIIAACQTAQAHEFIMSFPNGYETNLGQGGVNLSGGQKQRLCIARALLKNPKILILDDSTSAVDTATDAKIREEFRKNLKDITKIIIAQRITSICDADKIVVMDDGKINAVGTHAELLNTNDIYREVYESQQKGVA